MLLQDPNSAEATLVLELMELVLNMISKYPNLASGATADVILLPVFPKIIQRCLKLIAETDDPAGAQLQPCPTLAASRRSRLLAGEPNELTSALDIQDAALILGAGEGGSVWRRGDFGRIGKCFLG
jgi:hypothetical protein